MHGPDGSAVSGMNLRQLRYFVAVADLGGVGRASAHLNVAAPAISRSIATLEDSLGGPLFERDGRGMRLTGSGRLLHRKASQILRDVELARQEVLAEAAHLSGEVAIGATPSVIAMTGPEWMEAALAEMPRVRPRLLEGYSTYLQGWVLTGTVDFALVNGAVADSPRLVQRRLAVERLFAIGPPDAKGREGAPMSLAELLRDPLLLPSGANPVRALIDAAAASLGAPVATRLEIDSVTLLKDLARRGMARAVLPFGAVRSEVEAGLLSARPIVEPEVLSELSLVHLLDQPPTRPAARLIELFVRTLRGIARATPRHGFVEVRGHDAARP